MIMLHKWNISPNQKNCGHLGMRKVNFQNIRAPFKVKIQIVSKVGFMVFLKPRFQQSKWENNPTLWGQDIKQTVSKWDVTDQNIWFWHCLLKILAPWSQIVLLIAVLKLWFQDTSFEYHKPYFPDNLILTFMGGRVPNKLPD